jgi:hypothetical protein
MEHAFCQIRSILDFFPNKEAVTKAKRALR